MSFNVGDVVMLKSGGPLMTFVRRTNEKDCLCVWFETSKGEYHSYTFPEALIEKSDELGSALSADR